MSDSIAPTPSSQTNNTTNKPPSRLLIPLIIILVLIGSLSAYYFFNRSSAPTTQEEITSEGVATLSLDPESATVTKDTTFTVSIWVDTKDQPVNAVQAELNYPVDKFDFVSIDGVGSAFEIVAESSGKDGTITIARAQITPVVGKQLVAKVNLTPKVDTGSGEITFTDQSQVINSENNSNIIKEANGGNYTIKVNE